MKCGKGEGTTVSVCRTLQKSADFIPRQKPLYSDVSAQKRDGFSVSSEKAELGYRRGPVCAKPAAPTYSLVKKECIL